MRSMILILSLFSTYKVLASENCPNLSLVCSIETQDQGGGWRHLGKSSSVYLASPLHCTARVVMQDPLNLDIMYYAVASGNGDTILFTSVRGRVDYTKHAFGSSLNAPVALELGEQKLSCWLQGN